MDLNNIIFPAPKCSYSKDSRNLIWVSSSPINTPVYHVEARMKAREAWIQNKENNHQASAKQFSLFSMCMNSNHDTQNEVEVIGSIKPISIDENARMHSPYMKSKFARVAESLPSPPPYPDSFFRGNDISNFASPKKNKEEKQKSTVESKKMPFNKQENILMFNSPIRSKSAVDTREAVDQENFMAQINTPLKRAAELGPELKNVVSTSIPCLYLPYSEGSDKLLIYFHGNAEDLGYSYDFISNLRRYLRVNILAVEYPGYGLYEGSANSDQILADADSIYEFARTNLKVASQDIIIFGRSIGSGPASYIAGTRNIGALILMCPYTSIRGVAKNVAGQFLSYLVADRFRNIDYLKNAKVPSLLIHGEKDRLIPFSHSIELMKSLDQSLIHLSASMTHNEFDLLSDLIIPIKNFFKQSKITIANKQKIEVPHEYYSQPTASSITISATH